jgi:1,2-diacylglycerol 3-alpha-glucosyltransferase
MFSPVVPSGLGATSFSVGVPPPPADFERVGIITDHLRVSYANGSSFASQFLRREFVRRGHSVTVVGPGDPQARPEDLPEDCIALRSLPLRNHPGVQLPFPSRAALRTLQERRLQITLGQTCTGMLELGAWLRQTARVPYVCVNTVHLPSVYNVILPTSLMKQETVRRLFEERLIPGVEAGTVDSYNAGDGLIVLSQGMKDYWLERGVTVPVTVIPRSVDPKIFERTPQADPFDPRAPRGGRLLCVCRHTREKGLEQMLRSFARYVAPAFPTATLTLVGDGPDHDDLVNLAAELRISQRVFFPGEEPLTRVPDYYRHADLFLYTSLSDTYGQVVSEAAWCGLPCVGLRDGRGVSAQIEHGETGLLVGEIGRTADADEAFGAAVLSLLNDPARLRAMSVRSAERTRHRTAPERCLRRYYQAFDEAREHMKLCPPAPDARGLNLRLARWTTLHAALVGLGYLRRRASVNKNGSVQPNWRELKAALGSSAAN